ncbi:hypothetical protein TIFTF001_049084 [Ficus carica]|uniref:VWA-Hint protein Vwaint domain-containing protein n=1 Tax=Ficus carica TaxID=3494 RepID=A0AA87YWA3_FICCA|nr:hypothetical protein TIFTF001_049081 [Ficus carica]GMN23427.1 hypothetical protein TIFTF001_049082 [Ficus carica]GMN23444.1 hypothetical protein TIFTF001_049083 [Ficus carica]GMN23462.1 hypothetical protein TIFTF001_049084 [Ficus carica]
MVMVYLLLPKVDRKKSPADVLQVSYKYSSGKGKPFEAPPVTATVTRSGKARVKVIPKLILEESRLMALNSVKDARVLADKMELERAKNIVDEAKHMLEGVMVDDDPTDLIKTLIYDLQQLSEFMKTQKDYEEKGYPYALSFETSHDRQRYAARGDVDKVRSFATPRMNAYLEQAKKFDNDPNTPPPSVETDQKIEDAIKPPPPPKPLPPVTPHCTEIVIQVLYLIGSVLKWIEELRT